MIVYVCRKNRKELLTLIKFNCKINSGNEKNYEQQLNNRIEENKKKRKKIVQPNIDELL